MSNDVTTSSRVQQPEMRHASILKCAQPTNTFKALFRQNDLKFPRLNGNFDSSIRKSSPTVVAWRRTNWGNAWQPDYIQDQGQLKCSATRGLACMDAPVYRSSIFCFSAKLLLLPAWRPSPTHRRHMLRVQPEAAINSFTADLDGSLAMNA